MSTKKLSPVQLEILKFIGATAWCFHPWASIMSHIKLAGWPRLKPTKSCDALVQMGLIEKSEQPGRSEYQLSEAGWAVLQESR